MHKFLMALAAILISASTFAQSGKAACPNRPGCICPQATAQADAPNADAASTTEATATVVAEQPQASTPCPSRPGCICPGDVKAKEASAMNDSKAGPFPNRPECVCTN